MKKITLLLFCGTALLGFSQNSRGLHPASSNLLPSKPAKTLSMDAEKTLLCQDTLRYAQAKEQILGTGTFYTIDIWQSDNEAFSQTFLNSGSVILRGVEFFGMNNTTDGTPSVTVTASIYNVNAGFTPTTLVTSGTVTLTSTTQAYHHVTFASPVTVTGNYAVVIQATSTNGVFSTYVNNAAPSQTYDELYARFKSSYYASSSGNWITIPGFTELGNYNFEPLISPLVSYTLNAGFTASPTTACLGTPVTFTNTTTPTAFLTNRMYNYQVFRTFFGTAPNDSTYVYDKDNLTPLIWSANATYTYPAAGTYDALIGVNGGFWNSCFDNATQTITINALPATPTITAGGPTTFCPGGSVTLTSSAASGNNWSNGATTPSITVNTSGTYTVNTTSGCTSANSAGTVVTVASLDNATFTYPSNAICDAAPNQTPTTATAGSFSATPAGLSFVSNATGEIDVTGSSAGTYSVTYTTSGTCPSTSNQTIVISGAPDATFTYAQTDFCTADTDPNPVYGVGASAGAFSSTAGLVINGSNGQIDLSASTPGSYVVTNAIAANGSCPASSETFSVTIAQSPSALVTGGGQLCGTGTIPVNIELSGTGPWDIVYDNGSTGVPVTGITSSPFVINATTSGTYTVPSVTAGGCLSVGSGSVGVTFFTNPTVTFTPVADLCSNDSPVVLNASPAGGAFGGFGIVGNTFDPAGLTAGSITLTYGYTDANGCMGTAMSTFDLFAAPTVTMSALTDICSDASAITLTGGLPAGGIYSGTGVSGGSFDPGVAGIGTQNIVYTYTDGNGCSDIAGTTIDVNVCAGIDELESLNISLAPNPASESFVITNGGLDQISFTVISEDGKTVQEPKTIMKGTSETISVQQLAKGIYFVRFASETRSVTKKLIVN